MNDKLISEIKKASKDFTNKELSILTKDQLKLTNELVKINLKKSEIIEIISNNSLVKLLMDDDVFLSILLEKRKAQNGYIKANKT